MVDAWPFSVKLMFGNQHFSPRAGTVGYTRSRVAPNTLLQLVPGFSVHYKHYIRLWTLAMAEDNCVLPDLKDIETKMGRKVPESLVRSLVAGKRHDGREKSAISSSCKRRSKSADVERLEGKILFLRQEMVRSPPVIPFVITRR